MLTVRPFDVSDRSWAEELLERDFGGPRQVRRGEAIDVLDQQGLVAERDGQPAGLLTYRFVGDECELCFLAAIEQGEGVGTALVDAFRAAATDARRVWLVTTNDNLRALRFYQRRGFVLSALRPGALDEARRLLKPQLPRVGDHGVPLRDEIELELDVNQS